MITNLNSKDFLTLWKDVCSRKHEILYRDWTKFAAFTSHVMYDDHPLIETIAEELGLEYYCGYYDLDVVLFDKQDRVPLAPARQTWLRRIRIAFEHENSFTSGLFQELSHLLITDSDLRILVSYPDNEPEMQQELKYLHTVTSGSDRSTIISEKNSLLLIFGWRNLDKGTIKWDGYIYRQKEWEKQD